MKITEQQEQQAIFDYCHGYAGNLDDRLKMLFVIANGAWRGVGSMEAGVKESAGVPDMCLPVAIHPFHALFIELKTKTGKLSPQQRDYHKLLRWQGFAVQTCYGAEQGMATLDQYLAGEYPPF